MNIDNLLTTQLEHIEQKHAERLDPEKLETVSSDSENNNTTNYCNLNKNLFALEDDFLYHISLGKNTNDLKKMFSDVKFICMGGSQKRMLQFANYIKDEIGHELPPGTKLGNISECSDRYALYKVGPVLSVNHGIGCPSISILLHELIKLIHYAGCKDVTFFRIGTCGGLGIDPGTIVITNEAVDGMFRPEYRQIVLGQDTIRKTKCNQKLVDELLEVGKSLQKIDHYEILAGKTMCAHDFYEGQGRVDGAFCDYTPENKMSFLKNCYDHGIKNIEMESLCFVGLLNHAKLKAAVVCVSLVNRLNGDQVAISHETNVKFQERPFKLVGTYIKNALNNFKE
jgi:uridine phosphorylase